MGALAHYLDFININLFLSLLHPFGDQRDMRQASSCLSRMSQTRLSGLQGFRMDVMPRVNRRRERQCIPDHPSGQQLPSELQPQVAAHMASVPKVPLEKNFNSQSWIESELD